MREMFLVLSIIFLFLAVTFLIIYLISEKNIKGEAAFVGIIGFIPIAIGTSKKAILFAIILFFVFFLIFLILWFLLKYF